MEACIGVIFGGAVMVIIYETYYEKREKMVEKLLPTKLEELAEICSMKISKQQKRLERELSEDEKEQILDECYKEL